MTAEIPDGERIVGAYLRGNDERRVVGKTPDDTSEAWIKLVQLDASSDHRSDHLVEYFLQLDCYAGEDDDAAPGQHGQPEANRLGISARAALMGMPDHTFSDVVVTRCDVRGPTRVPDTDFETARERTVLTASVWMHAK